jgi:type VI protein secretion system component Hcp
MAIDTHIKFDGVDGESAHKDHKGEIQVISWSWQVSNPSAPFGGGSGQGKGDPGHFSFTAQLRQGFTGAGQALRRRQALQRGDPDRAQVR